MKTRRSTGTTHGFVISADLVLWEGGLGSHELCIRGEEEPWFATKGDIVFFLRHHSVPPALDPHLYLS